MTPCVVALLVGLLFLYAVSVILLLVLAFLLWSPAAVFGCFKMREPMTVGVCLVDEWLLVVLAVV